MLRDALSRIINSWAWDLEPDDVAEFVDELCAAFDAHHVTGKELDPGQALKALIEAGYVWCSNCDGRKCMDCVLRYEHDMCEASCPHCCRDHELGRWDGGRPLLATSLLDDGWGKEL